jgi:hypothetical protein
MHRERSLTYAGGAVDRGDDHRRSRAFVAV